MKKEMYMNVSKTSESLYDMEFEFSIASAHAIFYDSIVDARMNCPKNEKTVKVSVEFEEVKE